MKNGQVEVFSKRRFMKYRLHTPANELRSLGIGEFERISTGKKYPIFGKGSLTQDQIVNLYPHKDDEGNYVEGDLRYIRVLKDEMDLITKVNNLTKDQIIDSYGEESYRLVEDFMVGDKKHYVAKNNPKSKQQRRVQERKIETLRKHKKSE